MQFDLKKLLTDFKNERGLAKFAHNVASGVEVKASTQQETKALAELLAMTNAERAVFVESPESRLKKVIASQYLLSLDCRLREAEDAHISAILEPLFLGSDQKPHKTSVAILVAREHLRALRHADDVTLLGIVSTAELKKEIVRRVTEAGYVNGIDALRAIRKEYMTQFGYKLRPVKESWIGAFRALLVNAVAQHIVSKFRESGSYIPPPPRETATDRDARFATGLAAFFASSQSLAKYQNDAKTTSAVKRLLKKVEADEKKSASAEEKEKAAKKKAEAAAEKQRVAKEAKRQKAEAKKEKKKKKAEEKQRLAEEKQRLAEKKKAEKVAEKEKSKRLAEEMKMQETSQINTLTTLVKNDANFTLVVPGENKTALGVRLGTMVRNVVNLIPDLAGRSKYGAPAVIRGVVDALQARAMVERKQITDAAKNAKRKAAAESKARKPQVTAIVKTFSKEVWPEADHAVYIAKQLRARYPSLVYGPLRQDVVTKLTQLAKAYEAKRKIKQRGDAVVLEIADELGTPTEFKFVLQYNASARTEHFKALVNSSKFADVSEPLKKRAVVVLSRRALHSQRDAKAKAAEEKKALAAKSAQQTDRLKAFEARVVAGALSGGRGVNLEMSDAEAMLSTRLTNFMAQNKIMNELTTNHSGHDLTQFIVDVRAGMNKRVNQLDREQAAAFKKWFQALPDMSIPTTAPTTFQVQSPAAAHFQRIMKPSLGSALVITEMAANDVVAVSSLVGYAQSSVKAVMLERMSPFVFAGRFYMSLADFRRALFYLEVGDVDAFHLFSKDARAFLQASADDDPGSHPRVAAPDILADLNIQFKLARLMYVGKSVAQSEFDKPVHEVIKTDAAFLVGLTEKKKLKSNTKAELKAARNDLKAAESDLKKHRDTIADLEFPEEEAAVAAMQKKVQDVIRSEKKLKAEYLFAINSETQISDFSSTSTHEDKRHTWLVFATAFSKPSESSKELDHILRRREQKNDVTPESGATDYKRRRAAAFFNAYFAWLLQRGHYHRSIRSVYQAAFPGRSDAKVQKMRASEFPTVLKLVSEMDLLERLYAVVFHRETRLVLLNAQGPFIFGIMKQAVISFSEWAQGAPRVGELKIGMLTPVDSNPFVFTPDDDEDDEAADDDDDMFAD